jgi:hypothetical protein
LRRMIVLEDIVIFVIQWMFGSGAEGDASIASLRGTYLLFVQEIYRGPFWWGRNELRV